MTLCRMVAPLNTYKYWLNVVAKAAVRHADQSFQPGKGRDYFKISLIIKGIENTKTITENVARISIEDNLCIR